MPGWVSSSAEQEDNRYQVLVKTWHTVISFPDGNACQAHFSAKLAGRLNDEDWRILERFDGARHTLQVNTWSAVAEFRTEQECRDHAREFLDDFEHVEVAMRNSPEAAQLLEYGTKKLARLDHIRKLKDDQAGKANAEAS